MDQSCGQRDGVSGVCIQTLAISCTMIVSLQFERSQIYNREFYLGDVTDGMPSLWKLPVDVVSDSFQGLIQVAEKIESAVQLNFGLGFHSSTIEDDDHDALWLALFSEVRQPGSHTPSCSVTDCDACIERKLSSIGSTQHVREEKWMCVSRDVSDGKDCQTECAIIVRSILWRLRRERAMWIPTALEHRQIRCGISDCAFFFFTDAR